MVGNRAKEDPGRDWTACACMYVCGQGEVMWSQKGA